MNVQLQTSRGLVSSSIEDGAWSWSDGSPWQPEDGEPWVWVHIGTTRPIVLNLANKCQIIKSKAILFLEWFVAILTPARGLERGEQGRGLPGHGHGLAAAVHGQAPGGGLDIRQEWVECAARSPPAYLLSVKLKASIWNTVCKMLLVQSWCKFLDQADSGEGTLVGVRWWHHPEGGPVPAQSWGERQWGGDQGGLHGCGC